VIVVDDFSTDATAQRVRASQPAFAGATEPTVRLLQLDQNQHDNGGHKPEAVARGVEAASGTVVLTTDADCIVGPNWIRSMVRRCTPETPFVAGAVRYRFSHRYFERLQALAFAGLVAFGAGTLGLRLPTYCNSANLAFRRDLLDTVPDVSGERDGAAGDELLLQHVAYGTDRDVAFNADPDAAVTTEPAPDVDAYVHQQARWASMGARYPFLRPRLLVVSMWALHPVLLGACAAALALPAWRQPTLAALLAKMAGDLLLTVPFLKHYDQNELSRSTIATELMLLVVVPIAGFLGSFGTVEWKGRTLD
jgi:cellulose synthase/poly-beta-1,6-N-acetylglucosamine synthase-like glycosyltransferase